LRCNGLGGSSGGGSSGGGNGGGGNGGGSSGGGNGGGSCSEITQQIKHTESNRPTQITLEN